MDPQNAAMISAYARYANGIAGSEAYLPPDMQDAPELVLHPGHKGVFVQNCPAGVNEMMTRIWTDLQK
jgi:spermidine/putrescine transport system substrate-binding protein